MPPSILITCSNISARFNKCRSDPALLSSVVNIPFLDHQCVARFDGAPILHLHIILVAATSESRISSFIMREREFCSLGQSAAQHAMRDFVGGRYVRSGS